MNKEKLIAELQKTPDGIDVCIFNQKQNENYEDCSIGIHDKFSVEVFDKNIDVGNSKKWVGLVFDQSDDEIIISKDQLQKAFKRWNEAYLKDNPTHTISKGDEIDQARELLEHLGY